MGGQRKEMFTQMVKDTRVQEDKESEREKGE